jgi:hypothetical protein
MNAVKDQSNISVTNKILEKYFGVTEKSYLVVYPKAL